MRPAGTFATILAVGVLIVLIYQWSGDSIIVLIMCLLTLFVLLALWDRKPWQVDPDEGEWPDPDRDDATYDGAGYEDDIDQADHGTADESSGRTGDVDEFGPPGSPDETETPVVRPFTEDSPIWRCRFDVELDDDGVTGLALGEREPRRWPWDLVISAGAGWSAAIAEEDRVEERVGLHLGLADKPTTGSGGPVPGDTGHLSDVAQLMFGAGQHPGAVLGAIRRGIETAKVRRSRFNSLTPGERTRQLANALSPEPIALTKHIRSPELLYQDARRTLLTNRTLRRVSRDAEAEQILTAVEQLFAAHGAMDLGEVEFGPLGAAADRGDSENGLPRRQPGGRSPRVSAGLHSPRR